MNRREAAVLVVGAVVAFAVVDWLGDRTQTRPETVPKGSSTEVVFEVKVRGTGLPTRQAAQGLWGACQHTVQRRTDAGDVAVEGTVARVVVTPGLGRQGRQRLRGCLEDLTVDRTQAAVLRMDAR